MIAAHGTMSWELFPDFILSLCGVSCDHYDLWPSAMFYSVKWYQENSFPFHYENPDSWLAKFCLEGTTETPHCFAAHNSVCLASKSGGKKQIFVPFLIYTVRSPVGLRTVSF